MDKVVVDICVALSGFKDREPTQSPAALNKRVGDTPGGGSHAHFQFWAFAQRTSRLSQQRSLNKLVGDTNTYLLRRVASMTSRPIRKRAVGFQT